MFFKKKAPNIRESKIENLQAGDVVVLRDFQSLAEKPNGVHYTVLNVYVINPMNQANEANSIYLWELEEDDDVYLMTYCNNELSFYFIPLEPQNRHELITANDGDWLFDQFSEQVTKQNYLDRLSPPPFEELGQDVSAQYDAIMPTLYGVIEEKETQYMACQFRLYHSNTNNILNRKFLIWEQNWLSPETGDPHPHGGVVVLGIGCVIKRTEYDLFFS